MVGEGRSQEEGARLEGSSEGEAEMGGERTEGKSNKGRDAAARTRWGTARGPQRRAERKVGEAERELSC